MSNHLNIGFYLQEGVEILDFAGPMEVFAEAGYKIFTISKTKHPITSQNILKIIPDYDFNDCPEADVLAFFGGEGVKTSNDTELISWVISRIPRTKYFFSVCSGAFILGKAGILKGCTATTFHSLIDEFAHTFPETKVLSGVRYVDNGSIITTAGISAGIDGALHFVSKMSGADVARKVAILMEYDKWVPDQGLIL